MLDELVTKQRVEIWLTLSSPGLRALWLRRPKNIRIIRHTELDMGYMYI